jgi:hypothetical protein
VIPEHSAKQAITLAEQGWTVSQIARHLGHDRKTIRIYLGGSRAPGQRRPEADSFVPFAGYAAQRVRDDPHLRACGLHRELVELGYAGSYSALTRALRTNGIGTLCELCQHTPANASTLTPIGFQWYRPGQSLPIRVAPLSGETIVSYLRRLAAGNHVPLSLILAHLPSWFTARTLTHDDLCGADRIEPAGIECLALLTGLTMASLLRALPAFGLGHRDRTRRPPVRAIHACRRCAARHGRTGPVSIHLPPHQRLCRRHRIWLGGACQIDLATAPEVVHAHRRAARLAHRYGVLRLLHTEITTRQQIGAARYPDPVQQRIDKMTASNPGLIVEQPDLIEAATYPEVISSAARALSKTS